MSRFQLADGISIEEVQLSELAGLWKNTIESLEYTSTLNSGKVLHAVARSYVLGAGVDADTGHRAVGTLTTEIMRMAGRMYPWLASFEEQLQSAINEQSEGQL